MTTREITIAFELAIGIFAIYLLVRRLARLSAVYQNIPPFTIVELPDTPILDTDLPVTIAWFKCSEEAEMWAENLRQAGIEATLSNTNAYTPSPLPPQLKVRSEDAHRAVQIMREAEGS